MTDIKSQYVHHNSLNVGRNRDQFLKQKKQRYPFPSLLLQERPDHSVQGMDIPRLVDEMNSSKSCGEAVLEQHKGREISTGSSTLELSRKHCMLLHYVNLYTKEKGTGLVTVRISEESPTVSNKVNPSQKQVSKRNFNIFHTEI